MSLSIIAAAALLADGIIASAKLASAIKTAQENGRDTLDPVEYAEYKTLQDAVHASNQARLQALLDGEGTDATE